MKSHGDPPRPAAVSHRPPGQDRENIVQRLRRRADEARRMGFEVRAECLEGQHATWCQIGDRRIVFMDLSQSAAEQLQQLDETLASFQQSQAVAHPAGRGAI